MTKGLFRLNIKLVLSSLIFKVFYIFTAFFFCFFVVVLDVLTPSGFINYLTKFDSLTYLEMALCVLLFSVSVYFSHQPCTLEVICFVPKEKMISNRLFAVITATSLILAIPILYIIIFSFLEHTGVAFAALSLLYAGMRWFSLVWLADIAGFLLGYWFQSAYAYLLAAPFSIVFGFMNTMVLKYIPHLSQAGLRKISAWLSLQKPFIHGLDMDYTGPRLDLFYSAKFVIVLFAGALFFVCFFMVLSPKIKKRTVLCLAVSIIGVSAGSAAYFHLFPTTYDYGEKLYQTDAAGQECEVLKYEGELSLAGYTDGVCTLTIRQNAPGGGVRLRLDAALIVEEISCRGAPVNYRREGDYIELQDDIFSTSSTVPLTFRYSGRVYYISDIDCVNLFSTEIATAFPPNFAFLPIIDGDDSLKEYEFLVQSNNTVISNLDTKKTGGDQYLLSGKSRTFCLFSGFLREFEQDGIKFYRAAFNNRTNYMEVYQDNLTRRHLNPQTRTLSDIPMAPPDKVFLIYYLYGVLGFPVEFDRYIMINYGYAF